MPPARRRSCRRNVDEGRIGFKTKRGFFEWDDESIAKERARYEHALRKCLEIFREEGILLGSAAATAAATTTAAAAEATAALPRGGPPNGRSPCGRGV